MPEELHSIASLEQIGEPCLFQGSIGAAYNEQAL